MHVQSVLIQYGKLTVSSVQQLKCYSYSDSLQCSKRQLQYVVLIIREPNVFCNVFVKEVPQAVSLACTASVNNAINGAAVL